MIDTGINCWNSKNEEIDNSESSWVDEYSTETEPSCIYVNNMNAKNNALKTKEQVVLAGLQEVIDMCTPQNSVSDVIKNQINNDTVIDWVEKEFVLLDKELKNCTGKKNEKSIAKRKGMLKGIRNLVQRKSQLDMEAGMIETVNSKDEIMVMSFVRPEVVAVNQNRLRAGAKDSSSRSSYSKYSQTSSLVDVRNVQSKTQETQTKKKKSVTRHKVASSLDINIESCASTSRTEASSVNSSAPTTGDSFSSISSTNSTNTNCSETGCESIFAKDNLRYLCSSCAGNDALLLNSKVSMMSTNNLKVIHISLGTSNKLKPKKIESACVKCLKDKEINKKETPKLCLNQFVEITGNKQNVQNISKDPVKDEHLTPTSTLFKANIGDQNTLKMTKTAKHETIESNERNKLGSGAMTSLHSLKTSSVCNKSVTYSTMRSLKNKTKKSSHRGIGLKKRLSKVPLTIKKEKGRSSNDLSNNTPDNRTTKKSITSNGSSFNDSSSWTGNEDVTAGDVKQGVCEITHDQTVPGIKPKCLDEVLLSHEKKIKGQSKTKRKKCNDITCALAMEKDLTLSADDLTKQDEALEAIRETNECEAKEHAAFSAKIPSQKTLIVSGKSSMKTYHVQTPHYGALFKGAEHGDHSNSNSTVKKKISRQDVILKSASSALKELNTVYKEENFKSSLCSSEAGSRKRDSDFSKQLNELLESPSDDDSLKMDFHNLHVENPEGIDIESKKVSETNVCRLKNAKRFNLFGHRHCDCTECVKNRPVEIRYATTKISKFERYSTFEIYKSFKSKPKFLSATTESIFVKKNKDLGC